MVPALHDPEAFELALNKWKQVGVLYADDIVKNSPASYPVDYHLRVSENELRSGFGQVDKNGRLQGIGREV